MTKSGVLIVVLFAAAAVLRFADVFRPIDKASWRECDEGSIARNFATEGMNPLYPRIDWRGDGPGYAEMEFPLYPWLTAITYKLFGIHDWFARGWAFLFSLGSLFFFFRLARHYLSPFAATVAFAFFALNPLMVEIGTSVQPEGLMIMTYIAAVYFFLKWLRTDGTASFAAALGFTALTLLSKAPSAHIGLLFGVLLLEKYGRKVVREWRVWTFGVLSVLPAALWYAHAKQLWLTYGNSLGVSNEYHWVGWDFFTDPSFMEGILRSEFLYVWLSFGLIVGAFAVWRGLRETPARHMLLWLASIFAFYILAARTTSEDWAYYYHAFSIAPVAILFGFSIKKLWDYTADLRDQYSRKPWFARLAHAGVALIVLVSILASLLLEAKQVKAKVAENHLRIPPYAFADSIKPLLTTHGLIIASGGRCFDDKGYQLAYNASYMFYWLERKGWNLCVEEQSAVGISALRRRGAVYFLAEKKYLEQTPGLDQQLRDLYGITAETDDFVVFDLNAARTGV